MVHSFKNYENAIMVIPSPALSRGLENFISKEEVLVSKVEGREVKINNRSSPICTYEIISLYGVVCGKRIDESILTAFLFASEQDYDLAVKGEKILSEILSHAKSENIKSYSVADLQKILSLIKG